MDVDVASNGLEALVLMETKKYDIVFMNCMMPLMDGLEATRRIRELEKRGKPRSTVVAWTSYSSDQYRDECSHGN